jgi:phosphate:Na+ symporter
LKKIKILEIESIDDLYNKKIKNLYGEILDFITNAQALNSKKYYNNFYKIKSINIKIVQNIKILLDLQKNILKYSKSSNSNIKDEYNKIIIDLIYFIKDINKIVSLSNYEEKILYTSELELLLDKNNKKNNKNIDKLIRGGLITNEMTSSLINDNNNKNLIIGNIFDISQTIFIDKISNELNEN